MFSNLTLRNELKQGLNHISFKPMSLNEMVFVVLDAWKQIWDSIGFIKHGLNLDISNKWIFEYTWQLLKNINEAKHMALKHND